MPRYAHILEDSCEQLSILKNKQFNPTNTQDIAIKLSDLIRKHPDTKEPMTFNNYRQINNIDFFKFKASNRNENDDHCLFVGIDLLTAKIDREIILGHYCNLVSSLWNEFDKFVRRRLIIFDTTNILTEDDIEHLEHTCQHSLRVRIHLC